MRCYKKNCINTIPNSKHIPYLDQFQSGGLVTVRGYSEGLLIGRSGYLVSAELQFPVAPRTIKNKDKTKEYPFLGSFIKGFIFAEEALFSGLKHDSHLGRSWAEEY